jgi:hypothetical protein
MTFRMEPWPTHAEGDCGLLVLATSGETVSTHEESEAQKEQDSGEAASGMFVREELDDRGFDEDVQLALAADCSSANA